MHQEARAEAEAHGADGRGHMRRSNNNFAAAIVAYAAAAALDVNDEALVRFSIDFHCLTTDLRLIWVYFDEQTEGYTAGVLAAKTALTDAVAAAKQKLAAGEKAAFIDPPDWQSAIAHFKAGQLYMEQMRLFNRKARFFNSK